MAEILLAPANLRVTNVLIAVAGMLGATAAIYSFSRYEFKVGMRAGSPSLIADARHVSTDLLSSSIVVIGLLAGRAGWSAAGVALCRDEMNGSWPYYVFMAKRIKVNFTKIESMEEIKKMIRTGRP